MKKFVQIRLGDIDLKVLRAVITRSGGEIIPFEEGKGIILSDEQ